MKKTCFNNSADFFTAINEWGKFTLSSTTSALLDNVSVKQSSDTYCPEGKQSSSVEMKRIETCPVSTDSYMQQCRQQDFSYTNSMADHYSHPF